MTSNLQGLIRINCPGHAGVRDTERADGLVSKAPITGTLTCRNYRLQTIRDDSMRNEVDIEETTRS